MYVNSHLPSKYAKVATLVLNVTLLFRNSENTTSLYTNGIPACAVGILLQVKCFNFVKFANNN